MDNPFLNDIDDIFKNPFVDSNVQNFDSLSKWSEIKAKHELAKQQRTTSPTLTESKIVIQFGNLMSVQTITLILVS